MILRQHYLIGGENLVNEWHLQYLAEQEAAEKAPSQGGRTLKNALATIRNILDPSNQVLSMTSMDASRQSRLVHQTVARCASPSFHIRKRRVEDTWMVHLAFAQLADSGLVLVTCKG